MKRSKKELSPELDFRKVIDSSPSRTPSDSSPQQPADHLEPWRVLTSEATTSSSSVRRKRHLCSCFIAAFRHASKGDFLPKLFPLFQAPALISHKFEKAKSEESWLAQIRTSVSQHPPSSWLTLPLSKDKTQLLSFSASPGFSSRDFFT